MEQVYHTPVLLKESIEGLNIKPNGVYVDVTFGGGGHSKEILKQLLTTQTKITPIDKIKKKLLKKVIKLTDKYNI